MEFFPAFRLVLEADCRDGSERIEVQATGSFFSDDGDTKVAAACEGLGIALVPEWLARAELRAGRLTEVLGGFLPDPATTPLHALYAPGPYTPPKVRAFVDYLAERYSRTSW